MRFATDVRPTISAEWNGMEGGGKGFDPFPMFGPGGNNAVVTGITVEGDIMLSP